MKIIELWTGMLQKKASSTKPLACGLLDLVPVCEQERDIQNVFYQQ